MCFDKITRNQKYKIATENIPCWKVVKRNNLGCFQNLTIDGIVEKWEEGTHYMETTPFKGSFRKYEIEGNAFHSKKTKILAIWLRRSKFLHGRKFKVVEMHIPKGAKYYENEIEYCSSEIVLS